MAVAADFIEHAQVAKALIRPELAATFEPALLPAARRFDRSGADGPPSFGDLLVVHPTGMRLKVVLFAPITLPASPRRFVS